MGNLLAAVEENREIINPEREFCVNDYKRRS